MKRIAPAVLAMSLLAGPVVAAGPVLAAEDEKAAPADPEALAKEVERKAREAAKDMLGMLQLFIGRIPQYEAPEVLPNGDIIIRRKQPKAAEPPTPREKPAPKGSEKGDVRDL